MGLIYLEGIGQVEVEGNTLDIDTLKLVKEYQKQKTIEGGVKGIAGTASSKDRDEFGNLVAPEVSSRVRFAVSAAPNLESKVKTLKKFYDKVEQDEAVGLATTPRGGALTRFLAHGRRGAHDPRACVCTHPRSVHMAHANQLATQPTRCGLGRLARLCDRSGCHR
jgi:hypothetical protein